MERSKSSSSFGHSIPKKPEADDDEVFASAQQAYLEKSMQNMDS